MSRGRGAPSNVPAAILFWICPRQCDRQLHGPAKARKPWTEVLGRRKVPALKPAASGYSTRTRDETNVMFRADRLAKVELPLCNKIGVQKIHLIERSPGVFRRRTAGSRWRPDRCCQNRPRD